MYRCFLKVKPSAMMSRLYDWHGWYGIILNGWQDTRFHQQPRSENRSILYRVENEQIVVQSTERPDQPIRAPEIASCVIEEYNPKPFGKTNIEVVMAVYTRGKRTKGVAPPGVRKNPTAGLYLPLEKRQFFLRKMQDNGFVGDIISLSVGQTFSFSSPHGQSRIELPVANFKATVDIKDTNAFLDMMKRGVSRNKDSGCGLIVLR
jgi:hypothetical protein